MLLAENVSYATWIGSNGQDVMGRLATDASGRAWAAFHSGPGLKTTPGAYQPAYAGNVDTAAARFDFEVSPWTILAGGLAGKDLPSLIGIGNLTSGSTTRFALRGAPPSSPGWLLAGIQQIDLPFLGGTLVPLPITVVPWTSDPDGAAELTLAWPAAPPGTKVFFQAACLDPQAAQGWSASNGLMASSP
jgi:hypothetical protein